jgi:hypothetical protein
MEMQNNDIIFKKGERVSCIGGGLHIECVVIEESNIWNDVKVLDPLSEREIWISRNQIDHDKQYYRDKVLKELGI